MLKPFARFPRETLLGSLLAGVSVVVLSLLPGPMRLEAASMLLVLIAAVYIGFALSDERPKIVRLEITGAAGFVGLAVLGLWVHPWILAAGYFLHGFWDLFHHEQGIQTQITGWYPPVCVVYDWIVGLALTFWIVNGSL